LDEDSRERRGRIKKEKEEKGEDEGEFFHIIKIPPLWQNFGFISNTISPTRHKHGLLVNTFS